MTILRKDLKEPTDLKEIFNDIRNHLAGNFKGITRDTLLVEQVIFLLLCKIQDEKNTLENEPTVFQLTILGQSLKDRLNDLFQLMKTQFGNILQSEDKLVIDESNLQYIVRKIQLFEISKASDAIGDAFEQVMLPSLRGSQGQFFTPKNIVTTVINILKPSKDDLILDPACGTGGFLTNVLLREENQYLDTKLFGIDKDAFLAKITRLYLALLDSSHSKVFCDNSLEIPSKWSTETHNNIEFEKFDVIMTNPPFGVKIPIKDQELLKSYDLGHKWLKDVESGQWIKTSDLHERQPPQILFIERCLKLLKRGGKMGIVLPEGVFGNPRDRYIIDYLLKNYKILAIISCGHLAYMPHTHIKTSLLFIEKISPPPSNSYPIFVAVADKVGHDKNGKVLYKIDGKGKILKDERGNKVVSDDFPAVVENYQLFRSGKKLLFSLRGFILNRNEIYDNILIPKYYNPEIKHRLQLYRKKGYELISIKELIENKVLSIQRGHEVGAKFYGTGKFPFVRTSDLINLEINTEPLKQVAEDVYLQYKKRQDIQGGDILIVNDGTYLIGRTAIVTASDMQIVIQSHLKKIRVLKNDFLDEYLLLWSLNTPIVLTQIRAKTFVQATISTLGDRLQEVILVLPSDKSERERISKEFQTIVNKRQQLKTRFKNLIQLS